MPVFYYRMEYGKSTRSRGFRAVSSSLETYGTHSHTLSSTWPDCVFRAHISFANMLKNAMMRKRQQNRMAFSAKRVDKAAPSVAPSVKKTTIS